MSPTGKRGHVRALRNGQSRELIDEKIRSRIHQCRPFAAIVSGAGAQTPTINTFFPIGGQAGKTVEVEIRGASLENATGMLVHGSGLMGSVGVSTGKTDEAGKQVWQSKCATCHELRSPANRSMTTAQWSATI